MLGGYGLKKALPPPFPLRGILEEAVAGGFYDGNLSCRCTLEDAQTRHRLVCLWLLGLQSFHQPAVLLRR